MSKESKYWNKEPQKLPKEKSIQSDRRIKAPKEKQVGGGSIPQWLAYLLPDPAAPGSIHSIPV